MNMAVTETDRRVGNIIRVGTVVSVDPGGPTAVVNFGDITSPALQVGQLAAGALSFWWIPAAGDQVIVACPSGDVGQGIILASVFAGNAPSSDPATPMMALAGGKAIIDGNLEVTGTIKAGVEVEAAGIKLTTHKHPGVTRGGAKTEEPV